MNVVLSSAHTLDFLPPQKQQLWGEPSLRKLKSILFVHVHIGIPPYHGAGIGEQIWSQEAISKWFSQINREQYMVKCGLLMLVILKDIFLKFQNQHPPLQVLSGK